MRRFLSRSRSVPVAAPEWQCPGKLAYSSSMSSASSASSSSPSSGSEDMSTLEEMLDDGAQGGRSTPSGRREPVLAASYAKDCSCGSPTPDRRHTVSEILDNRSPPVQEPATHNARHDCCFEVVNKWSPSIGAVNKPTPRIIIHDPYLLTVCKDLMPERSNSSSSAIQLEFDLDELLGLLPRLEDYRDGVRDHASRRDTDGKKLKAVSALANYLRKERQGRFDKLDAHISRGEITFDGLFAIFVPRTAVVSKCATTGEWRAYRLKSANRVRVSSMDVFHLVTESIDVVDDEFAHCDCCSVSASRPQTRGSLPGNTLKHVQSSFLIPRFDGVAAICSLQMFPLRYHPDAEELTTSLVARGKRWLALQGVHHMHYSGSAAYTLSVDNCKTTAKYEVRSPIIVDRVNFRRLNPDYDTATNCDNLSVQIIPGPFGPDELLLAPATVYGYSLANQKWLEFNIAHVQPLPQTDSVLRTSALHSSDVSAVGDHLKSKGPPNDTAGTTETTEAEATSSPSLDQVVNQALTSVKTEVGLHMERLCKEEMAAIVASFEERFTSGLSELESRYSSEFALHRKLMRLILVVSAVLVLVTTFLLYRTVTPSSRPSRWVGITHFTIPILSPFASVVEHESSLFNFSHLLSLLFPVGLFMALRMWCGVRRK